MATITDDLVHKSACVTKSQKLKDRTRTVDKVWFHVTKWEKWLQLQY